MHSSNPTMIQNPISYLQNLEVIKRLKESLSKFADLEVALIDSVSGIDHFPCALKGDTANPSGASDKTCCQTARQQDCSALQEKILKEIVLNKKPQIFFCPFGLTKIVVPLILKDELIGVFLAGENGTVKIDRCRAEALCSLLSEIGSYILESELALCQNYEGNGVTHKQELINKVVRYIQNNAHRNEMTLQDVARSNGVSYFYLSHLFKNELKTTFVEYRKHVKMQMAAKMLRDFRLTVDQISRSCGYEDPSYFCKSFKKAFGFSPTLFRRRLVSVKRRKKSTHRLKKHNELRLAALCVKTPRFNISKFRK